MYELKLYRGVICHDNEEWWKIWRTIELLFQNWHEEIDKFWPKHSEVSKMWSLMGSFWPKCIMFELSFMTLKCDAKFEEKIACCLENDIRNMFLPEHAKDSKLGLWQDPFIQSRKCMSSKFRVELCVMTIKNNAKLEEELTLSIQDWLEEFDNFWPENSKISKICILMGCF